MGKDTFRPFTAEEQAVVNQFKVRRYAVIRGMNDQGYCIIPPVPKRFWKRVETIDELRSYLQSI